MFNVFLIVLTLSLFARFGAECRAAYAARPSRGEKNVFVLWFMFGIAAVAAVAADIWAARTTGAKYRAMYRAAFPPVAEAPSAPVAPLTEAPVYFPLPTVAPLSETEQYARLLRVIDTLPDERRARLDEQRARRIARRLSHADRYNRSYYPPS